ncbi:trem-like transcript 4 protein [Seriola aureovittata]|uniref:trem-like transcript 4 protein n=1 Tax=Seriola aureovittata TaxID=2871759 RepID=UPI0024BE9A56|nr:trem-like transcript 4 protein [Seriola aureovittata]
MFQDRPSGGGDLHVTITRLTQSDSGRYGCGLDKLWSKDPYREFEIIVTNAPSTSKPTLTLGPLLTSVPSASTPTTQSLRSSTTASSTEQQQTERAGGSVQTTTGVLRYLGLTVVALILLSLGVLILRRKRATRPKGPPGETAYADITEDNRMYEEIREDRNSRHPPVEVFTVYACAKYTEPNAVETPDDYSLVTATAAMSQNNAEDD